MTEAPEIDASGDGIVVTVHVQPGASSTEIVGLHGDALKLRVTEPATQNRANAAVEKLLADTFEVPARSVGVTKGHNSRRKRVTVEGMTLERAREILRPHAG